VHIPGKSGLDILKELHGEDYPAPIFMISGLGDIAMAVTASKAAPWISSKAVPGSEIVARWTRRSALCTAAGGRQRGKSRSASFSRT